MANIFNDLNKLVNTVQKVDRLLSEKPKRKAPKRNDINYHLEGLIKALHQRPRNEMIGNLHHIIDNLNEQSLDYTISLTINK